MTAENYTNFGTSTLNGAITSGATTMTVATGQGSLFPLSNFLVTVDTEVMLVSNRAADVFTFGGRGYDSTVAASHASGATVQLCPTAYTFRHLWQNVADTFLPDVPPVQQGNTPSSYDAEWETGGSTSWSLYPTAGLPSGATFAYGSPLKSCLVLKRGASDNTLYTASIPFSVSPPFQLTCKLSHAVNLSNSTSGAEVHFFITDQVNPTSSADSGNRIRVDSIIECWNQTSTWQNYSALSNNAARVRMLKDVSGTGTQIGPSVPVTLGQPLYLRISCTSSYTYSGYIGDGTTFTVLSTYTTSFTPQSIGVCFYANPQATSSVSQAAVVDWIRVDTGTFNTAFGP